MKRFLVLCGLLVLAIADIHPAGIAVAGSSDTPRIVSIGGSVTEILFLLGMKDQVVAVDSTSVHPPSALQEKTSVGYMRALAPEGVLTVNPTMIIAVEGSGPPRALEVLKQSKVDLIIVKNDTTIEGTVAKVRQIAAVVGAEEKGRVIAAAIRSDYKRLQEMLGKVSKPKRVLFLLSARPDRLIAGGAETSADAIIKLAGASNAIADFNGYKQVSAESISLAKPDVIVLIDSGPHPANVEDLLENALIKRTPAGQNGHILTMDGQLLLGFGPRVAQAARILASKLYPKLGLSDPVAAKPVN